MTHVKTAGQAVTTAAVVTAVAPTAPLLAFIGGLANFFGWEFVMAQDENTELVKENAELEEENWNLTRDEWEKEKAGLLAPVYQLGRSILRMLITCILGYFGLKFLLKRFVLSKREARRWEEWEDRVTEKAVDRLRNTGPGE